MEQIKHPNYNGVDLCKFLCSLLVVAIHVNPLTSVHWLLNYGVVNYIAPIAVPFFFTVTGFFLVQKSDTQAIMKTIGKMLKLYLLWTIIYAPIAILQDMDGHTGFAAFGGACLTVLKNFFCTGSYGHLWYLNATIVALLLILLLRKCKCSTTAIFAIGVALYLIGLTAQSYFGLIRPLQNIPTVWNLLKAAQNIMPTTRNGLFEGLCLIAMGMYIAQKPTRLTLRTSLIGLAASMLFLAAEILILVKLDFIRAYNMFLGLLPATYFLLQTALRLPLPDHPIYKKLRAMSSMIYFSHMLVYTIAVLPLESSGILTNSLGLYGLTVLLTIALSAGIITLSKRKRFDKLHYIYHPTR